MSVVKPFANLLRPVLENNYVKRVRRNHGLEHATIHILNRQRYRLSGRASAEGFFVFGDVPTEKVEKAAEEALRRMKGGQSGLAIHPNCGTNLVVTALLMTTIAALGFSNTDRKGAWDRFPIVMVIMMLAAMYSQPLGYQVQEHITTSGDPGDTMQVIRVQRSEMNLPLRDTPLVVHQVYTHGG
jgi:hypothetical protein